MAATTVAPAPKIKILMLHGFAQSGPFFQIKTRAVSKILRETISNCYKVMADEVELVFPTAPLQLCASDLPGTCAEYRPCVGDSDTWAWWRNLDVTSRYVGIESSLANLLLLAQKDGPFTGVVGFSQGATLAAIFASWCEAGAVPGRGDALRETSHDDPLLGQLLSSPPQRPLDFALCFSGFRGTPRYYRGFYAPQIATPTIHIIGALDTMISRDNSEDLIASCLEPKVVEHLGVHFVPRDVDVLNQIAKGLESIVVKATAAASALHPSLLLRHSGLYETTLAPGVDIVLADIQDMCTPPSSPCSSETSSDSSWRPRSRRAFVPRIVRRYRLSRC
jgi:hypothetical protein